MKKVFKKIVRYLIEDTVKEIMEKELEVKIDGSKLSHCLSDDHAYYGNNNAEK